MSAPAGWEAVDLGDVVTLKRGYDLPAKQRRAGSVPVVSSSGVTGFHDEAKVDPPGVVTGRYGTLGEVFYVDEPFWPLNTTLYVQDFKGNDPHFVSYFLREQGFGQRSGAAAVPGVNRNALHRLPVLRPPLEDQLRIAAVLAAYDELIENNTRRIQILEEMAQAIYREWFVEFRYPGHEDVPLVDSDLGPIPQTSRVVTVSDLAVDQAYAVTSGPFGSKLGRKDYVSSGVPVIRGANLSVGGGFRDSGFVYVTEEKADDLRSSLAGPGDIVVTQRGTLGQVGRIPEDCRFPRYVLSQSQMKVTVDGREASSHYLYAVLRSPEATERIQNMAMSAGVPHINLTMLRDFRVVLPHREVQRAFESVAGPMLDLVDNLQLSTKRLRTTRDLLLPRLISGEVDVSCLDIDVGDAAA